jgi:hypothetical protein
VSHVAALFKSNTEGAMIRFLKENQVRFDKASPLDLHEDPKGKKQLKKNAS